MILRDKSHLLRYHLSQKLISADILRDLYLWYFFSLFKALFFLQRMNMWYFLVGDYVVFFLYYMRACVSLMAAYMSILASNVLGHSSI